MERWIPIKNIFIAFSDIKTKKAPQNERKKGMSGENQCDRLVKAYGHNYTMRVVGAVLCAAVLALVVLMIFTLVNVHDIKRDGEASATSAQTSGGSSTTLTSSTTSGNNVDLIQMRNQIDELINQL